MLIAFAAFILIEGLMIGFSRSNVDTRHASVAIMFPAAMIAALWRYPLTAIFAPIVAITVIIVANVPIYQQKWRAHVAVLDDARNDLRAGNSDSAMKSLGAWGWHKRNPSPKDLDHQKRFRLELGRLKGMRIGPYGDMP